MCRNSKFSPGMHIKCSNLNFNCFSIRANYSCMKRLIKIEFWHCNVILKSSRNWTPTCVYSTKGAITIANRINKNTNTNQVVDVIKFAPSNNHFLINTIKMLLSTSYLRLDLF